MHGQVTTIGIDLAKNVFQIHGTNERGRPLLRKRVSRAKLLNTLAQLPPCLVGVEACSGTHYWAREISKLGHTVKIMAPKYVTPYRKGGKNDPHDAEAISEAVVRENMRFVSPKSQEQLDMQAIHRVRKQLVGNRTALVNQIRGLLTENGIVMPKRIKSFRKDIQEILEDGDNGISDLLRDLLIDQFSYFLYLEKKVTDYDRILASAAGRNEDSKRLMARPGIGPITSTAFLAAIGDGSGFKSGRQAAAWIGLVPRQHSSGEKQTLWGITKKGNTYLRTLLIHGARAVVRTANRRNDALGKWIMEIVARRGVNVAVVALANKNARILWALHTKKEEYLPQQ